MSCIVLLLVTLGLISRPATANAVKLVLKEIFKKIRQQTSLTC